MPNTLRIKRRAVGGGVGAPSGLKNGELAFNEDDFRLYYGFGVGSGDNAASVITIGGSGAFVSTTGAQTIDGVKTFSSLIGGSINGNAATATALQNARNIVLSSDVGGTVSFDGSANVTLTATVANDSITNAKLANMAVNTIKGRVTTGTGDPEDLTAAQVRTILNVADGAQPNQNTFANFILSNGTIVATTLVADTATDTLTFIAGAGLDVSGVAGTDTMTLGMAMYGTARSANYTAVLADLATSIRFTGASALTLTLTATSILGDKWFCYVRNDTSQPLTIDPNLSELVDGAATLVIPPKTGIILNCTGTDFYTIGNALTGTSGAGMITRSATGEFTPRTITGTAGRIGVTNGDGASGNPTLDLATSGISAGTYTKLVVDVYGRSTASGGALLAADIPTLTAAKISDFDTQVRTSRLDQMAAPTASVSLNSQRITGLAEPVNSTDAATKNYVDSTAQGLDVKQSVRMATTANIVGTYSSGALTLTVTATGVFAVDGVNTVLNDRILVKDQTTATQNGIYVVTTAGATGVSAVLTRATDANTSAELSPGMFCFVEEGATNLDQGYVLTTNGPVTLDTTALTFTQFSGAGQIDAGNGLTKTGNTLNIGTAAATRIVVNADNIDLATIGNAGTYTRVVVDAYGRVASFVAATLLADYGITNAVSTARLINTQNGLTGGGDLAADRTLELTGQARSFHDLATNGIAARVASGSVVARTVTGTTSRITITNGDGVAGNPTIDIASGYVGQNTINTLGTIGTGTWQGSVIGLAYGGTGANLSAMADGAIFKKSGTAFIAATVGTDYLSDASTIDCGTF